MHWDGSTAQYARHYCLFSLLVWIINVTSIETVTDRNVFSSDFLLAVVLFYSFCKPFNYASCPLQHMSIYSTAKYAYKVLYAKYWGQRIGTFPGLFEVNKIVHAWLDESKKSVPENMSWDGLGPHSIDTVYFSFPLNGKSVKSDGIHAGNVMEQQCNSCRTCKVLCVIQMYSSLWYSISDRVLVAKESLRRTCPVIGSVPKGTFSMDQTFNIRRLRALSLFASNDTVEGRTESNQFDWATEINCRTLKTECRLVFDNASYTVFIPSCQESKHGKGPLDK